MYPDRYLCTKFVFGSNAESDSDIGINLNGNCQFAVDAWVRAENLQGRQEIFSQKDNLIFSLEQNFLSLELIGHKKIVGNEYPLLTNTWHYVCASYYDGYISLYLDGELIKEEYAKTSTKQLSDNNTNPFIIGLNLFGTLKQVRIYNFSLTESMIHKYMFFAPCDTYLQAAYDFSCCPPAVSKGAKNVRLLGGAKVIICTPAASCRDHAHIILPSVYQVNPGAWGEAFSIQLWANIQKDADEGYLTLFSNVDALHSAGFLLYAQKIKTEYHISVEYGYFDSDSTILTSVQAISSETWVNVAVTFSQDKLILYINGVKDSTTVVLLPVIDELEERSMRIGADLAPEKEGGEDWFCGSITSVDIWSAELSAQEISTYCNTRPDSTAPGLSASYDLNDDHWRSEVDQTAFTGVDNLAIIEYQQDAIVGDNEKQLCLCTNDKFESEPFSDTELLQFRRDIGIDSKKSNNEMYPFMVTHHEKNGRIYFVAHDGQLSYTVTSLTLEDATSDMTLWWIELFLLVAGGILSITASVKLNHTKAVANLINDVLIRMPTLTTMFNAAKTGTAMVSVLIAFMGTLAKEGILFTLLKMALSSGMWTLLWMVTKVTTKLTVGLPIILGELVALGCSVLIHINNMPLPALNISMLCLVGESKTGVMSLPLRIDYKQIVPVAAWNANNGKDQIAPALYCISDFSKQAVKKAIAIHARFKGKNLETDTLYVRAKETSGNLFGDSTSAKIILKSGDSGYVEIPFFNNKVAESEIGKQQVTLSWQHSTDNITWVDMNNATTLTVYLILSEPTAPWGRVEQKLGASLPWTKALDVYSEKLKSCKTTDSVAETITELVNDDNRLRYNGNSNFITKCILGKKELQAFNIWKFISIKDGDVLNCTDCATIVTTFANMYGCNLKEVFMTRDGMHAFRCNVIEAIGYKDKWNEPFDSGFRYHEVACLDTGEKLTDKKIYDACLKLNNSEKPWEKKNIYNGVLATGMAFSQNEKAIIQETVQENSYREHLARNTTDGVLSCFYSNSFLDTDDGHRPLQMNPNQISVSNTITQEISERYGFSSWAASIVQAPSINKRAIHINEIFTDFENGNLSRVEWLPIFSHIGGAEELYCSRNDNLKWARIKTVPFDSVYEAQATLLASLSESSIYQVPRLNVEGADHAFGNIGKEVTFVSFTVGYIYGQFTSVGIDNSQALIETVFQKIRD